MPVYTNKVYHGNGRREVHRCQCTSIMSSSQWIEGVRAVFISSPDCKNQPVQSTKSVCGCPSRFLLGHHIAPNNTVPPTIIVDHLCRYRLAGSSSGFLVLTSTCYHQHCKRQLVLWLHQIIRRKASSVLHFFVFIVSPWIFV